MVKATEDSLRNAERLSKQRQLEIGLLTKDKAIRELALKEKEAVQQNQHDHLFYIRWYGSFDCVGARYVARLSNKKTCKQSVESQIRRLALSVIIFVKQNENITKSINYAQGIQKALLPPQDTLVGFLEESFVYFRPRDLVSGDYYWFAPILPGTITMSRAVASLLLLQSMYRSRCSRCFSLYDRIQLTK